MVNDRSCEKVVEAGDGEIEMMDPVLRGADINVRPNFLANVS